jgi:hypothetical protein
MGKLILPIAPFEESIPYTRGGVDYKVVRGLNEEGYRYGYIEYVEPDALTGLTVRLVPSRMINAFNDYGVSVPADTYWVEKLFNNGVFIKDRTMAQESMITNHADMIGFNAALGGDIIDGIFNGVIRKIQGFNEQPLFRRNPQTGVREAIADSEYDTTIAPDKRAYDLVQPLREPDPVVEEEAGVEPTPEEPVAEEPTEEPTA